MLRYPLRTVRLRPGEELVERLEIPVEVLVYGGQEYAPAVAELPMRLTIQRATSGDVFRVQGHAALTGPCMRCLAEAHAEVEIDAREYQDASPDAEPELHTEYVADGELLLGTWVRDQIALGLPSQILCRPDCAGLCAVCGKDLNVEPHEHEDTGVDSRWAALESLRLED
jgi:uncharacterized protein